MAIWPVILSGGSGTRLWPLSRAEAPKQLLPLMGPETMIQATAARVGDPRRFLPPIVVCGSAHADAIQAQLGEAGHAPAALILEPAGRNTAPAIALAALWVAAKEADALILVMPSDHAIADVPAFLHAVEAAEPFAQGGWLVTFGIHAERPETGYGYIKMGEAIGPDVRQVERFIEKPPIEAARDYVADGGYAWNGGIFLMRAGRYLAELGEHAPAILAAAQAAMADAATEGARVLPDAAAFLASPSDSIDYAVMERAGRVAVAPVSMGWSDIGSWDALHAAGAADADGNVLVGDVLALGAENCLLRSDGPLVAVVGVSGISVIATADAVLVAGRDRAQEVKGIVDRLKAAGRPECERHSASAVWRGKAVRPVFAEAGVEVAELHLPAGGEILGRADGRYFLLTGDAEVRTADGAALALGTGDYADLTGEERVYSAGGARLLAVVSGDAP